MNDHELDKLIEAAAPRFRVPPEPDLDAIWDRISAQRHPGRRSGGAGTWFRWGAVAAAVVLSFALGRLSIDRNRPVAGVTATSTSTVPGEQPVTAAATELLGQTVVLLTALPDEQRRQGVPDTRFALQAGELLVTTRLLIDSRVAERDPALKSLLEDLELVLAQLARLRNGEARSELQLINDALQQQDIVPRIRSVAAGLSAGAD